VFVGKRCSDVCFTKEQNRIPRSTVTSLSVFRKSTTRYGHDYEVIKFLVSCEKQAVSCEVNVSETCADLLSLQTDNRPFPQWGFQMGFH